MASDVELLRAWRAGDRRAGSELFARHFDTVRRFFATKVDAQVEDLVQRTFIACVEGRDRFRELASFRTYLFAIAHNVLRGYIRGKRRGAPADVEEVALVDLEASPTAKIAARGRRRLLVTALRHIPVEFQVILEMYYWEGVSGPELAAFLEVPLAAARSKLRRAKERLAAEMERLAPEARLLDTDSPDLDAWASDLHDRGDGEAQPRTLARRAATTAAGTAQLLRNRPSPP
jgi:RNA polymerase sigma factor (sigma-70 family)